MGRAPQAVVGWIELDARSAAPRAEAAAEPSLQEVFDALLPARSKTRSAATTPRFVAGVQRCEADLKRLAAELDREFDDVQQRAAGCRAV